MTFLLIICWDEQMIKNDEVLPKRHFILPEGACGEGISKGNLVPLGPPVGVRDPLRRGPGFLLLFSIKSKEEILCFAERVPNRRLRRLSPLHSCAHQKRSPSTPFLYLFLYTSKENLTPFSSCISPFSSSSQSGFSSRFGKAVSAG